MSRRDLTRYTGTTGGTRRRSPRYDALVASLGRIAQLLDRTAGPYLALMAVIIVGHAFGIW